MRRTARFIVYLFRRFSEDRCLGWAAQLTYATLLSLVPLMAVSMVALSAFPVFEELVYELQEFVFRNFVPAAGETVYQYFRQFAAKATQLTAIGALILVLTALLMMFRIDRALNAIWCVQPRRKWLAVLMVYWSVLTLGPLLIGASLVVTSYLISLPLWAGAAHSMGATSKLLTVTPFLAAALAFTLLYSIVPNRDVPLRNAVLGGVLAAALFEAAKRGFAFYVTHFPTYEVIYGALATLPIFLVWVYTSWVVILLGAEFTHCLTVYRAQEKAVSFAGLELVVAFRVIGHLWQAQNAGRALTLGRLLTLEPGMSEASLQALLEGLQQTRLVHRTETGAWALSRDLGKITLLDLYCSQPSLPDENGAWARADDWNRSLHHALAGVNRALNETLRMPLKALFQEAETAKMEPGPTPRSSN